MFLSPNLRTAESIGKQRKIGHKTRFVYLGSPNRIVDRLGYCRKLSLPESLSKLEFR